MLNAPLLLLKPTTAWTRIAARDFKLGTALAYPLLFAILPAIAWYSGTTRIGWRIGSGASVRLTEQSALPIVVLFYLAMVGAVIAIGWAIHWMAQTYGARSTPARGFAVAGLTATPLFCAGAAGFYPLLLPDLVLGLLALGHAVYLLYTGIPIVMGIPPERGFLFASAIVAVCLVMLIAIMGASVLLWDFGAAPIFTD